MKVVVDTPGVSRLSACGWFGANVRGVNAIVMQGRACRDPGCSALGSICSLSHAKTKNLESECYRIHFQSSIG